MFLSPVVQLIPSYATAAALIYVGLLMMASIKNIDWNDFKVSVPAFLTLAVMPRRSKAAPGSSASCSSPCFC